MYFSTYNRLHAFDAMAGTGVDALNLSLITLSSICWANIHLIISFDYKVLSQILKHLTTKLRPEVVLDKIVDQKTAI